PPQNGNEKHGLTEAMKRRLFQERFWVNGVVWAKIGGVEVTENMWVRRVETLADVERIVEAAKVQGPEIMASAQERAAQEGGKVRPLHPRTWLSQGRDRDESLPLLAIPQKGRSASELFAEEDRQAREREHTTA